LGDWKNNIASLGVDTEAEQKRYMKAATEQSTSYLKSSFFSPDFSLFSPVILSSFSFLLLKGI